MAKNITIKEGAVAKNFTGVKKITTNQMGSGSVSWIPEDEAADYCTFKTITARKNGTYKAEDNACDGFSEVKVEVPADVKDKVITTNGEYIAAEDNCLGYRKVTVNVSGGGSGSGQHTVIFYAEDRTTILERVTVEDGGGAVYHGATPTSNGMRFVGWTPNPMNVKADMNCYPRFENIYDATQILDSWVTIAQNIRQNPDAYNIGQWKVLELYPCVWQGETVITQTKQIPMQLVAKGVEKLDGENGYAPTTWMAMSGIPESEIFAQNLNSHPERVCGQVIDAEHEWINGNLRAFFHSEEFLTQSFDPNFIKYLRRVIKNTTIRRGTNNVVVNGYPSIEWFWIPSLREVIGGCTDAGNYSYVEATGAVYDSVFGKDDTVANLNSRRILLSTATGNGETWCTRTVGNWVGYPTYVDRSGGIITNQNINAGNRMIRLCFSL